jgi:hypothetical protein
MEENVYKYAILGFGLAGQLLYLELIYANISPNEILCIDKSWLGGDLIELWPSVISNTPYYKTRQALEKYPSAKQSIAKGDSLYKLDECFPVGKMSSLVYNSVNPILLKRHCLKTTVNELIRNDSTYWSIVHSTGTSKATTVFLTQGCVPKSLDACLPTIPLNQALDVHTLNTQLSTYTNPCVSVFGCSHSGVIILDNLNSLNIPTYAIYKTDVPFYYESDGIFGGLKERTEAIARSITTHTPANMKLIKWSDTISVYNALQKSTHVIYAIGFEPRKIKITYNSLTIDSSSYSQNGQITNTTNLYGFGIAYPKKSVIDSKEHTIVSILAFQEHIVNCLPSIL